MQIVHYYQLFDTFPPGNRRNGVESSQPAM
jgi:hypothetical protein